jgi:hypothetical protein
LALAGSLLGFFLALALQTGLLGGLSTLGVALVTNGSSFLLLLALLGLGCLSGSFLLGTEALLFCTMFWVQSSQSNF